ncbi:hypothetical protein N2603_36810 [Bradyrhizobium huanghuaihaiense]|uniref:hypothetical protein n=1 Tax=Bradyrhizobium huanghuaihaiense TaxID=990078 RepID=UPI0021A9952E|nr:hypothetical protein [Bradyrhizobium sp. CB3035]UWU75524.1 hypothetical protein N2603_36810 [Bradyrhizobium sp. CB3035]
MYRIHPLAAAFPEMSTTVYDRLKSDLGARGQQRAIALYEGAVSQKANALISLGRWSVKRK